MTLVATTFLSAQQLQVDSVSVDSVWNSDSLVYSIQGMDTIRDTILQRDLYLSFIPMGEGMAECFVAMSVDSGMTWAEPADSLTAQDSGAVADTMGLGVPDTLGIADSLSVLDSGIATLVQCGVKCRVKLRVLGQDRPNVAFKIIALQWQPIIVGNPKQVTLGVIAALTPGASCSVNLQCSLENASLGLGFATISIVWWDAFGNGTWNDSTSMLSYTWLTTVPQGAAGQERPVIAKARDANGLWSAPCTLSVKFGITTRLLTMISIPAGTFQMGCTVPAVPLLSSPPDGAINAAVIPTLSWSTSAYALSYRVQVSNNPSFALVFDTTINGTSKQIPQLSSDSTYYWRVYANDVYGESSWSGVWSFTVMTGSGSALAKFMPTTFDSVNNGFNASPMHSVTLEAYTISQTLVTQTQYQAVMDTNPALFQNDDSASLRPVEQVSWYDAALFCNALSKQTGLDTVYNYAGDGTIDSLVVIDYTKNGYRLPTEAEYEYACRAGTTTDYYWGRNYPPLTKADTLAIDSNAVWYYNSPYITQPVADKRSNAWGLYDISGNVCEWCNDWYGNYGASSQTNPTGATSGSYRVLRGGSFYSYGVANDLCSAYRINNNPHDKYDLYGFRVVCGTR